ncbi:MAG: type II toxin-antitoxin system VapC family toxin [Brevundimonas sp.]|uniref:type II toxin-antitoxin system VapC family toxin n=1 Tax=Brevundimonas sp. TaxID=1871086 RepID=UPI0026373EA3|nr:type II toxin-antitoxin system VapC family toxin [Brevundimonas sp.]MDI6623689.1 type II toxin-antitoxin system VapC family toxin [Brevundimonas sp.]MDQ7813339.1 type II toxin-antitoxin system VapC family toxin [Brevundimonas sp.]
MKLIVDASAAASWLLASQATPSSTELLDRLGAFEIAAPHIFQWEIGNLLVRQTRRQPGFSLNEAFAILDGFRITLAPPTGRDAVRALAGIAAARGLSLFDAGYLWLAMQTDGAVASRDADLLAAATAAGLPVFDLRD